MTSENSAPSVLKTRRSLSDAMKGNTNGQTHGHTVGNTCSPTYYSWQAMLFPLPLHRAGQRGAGRSTLGAGLASVLDGKIFETFLRDMGPRPDGMTLDRIDNDGDYTADNCRWSLPREIKRVNRRNARLDFEARRRRRHPKAARREGKWLLRQTSASVKAYPVNIGPRPHLARCVS